MLMTIPKANFQFAASIEAENPIKQNEDLKIPNKLGGVWEHYRLPQELLDNEFNYPVFRDTLGIRWPGYWFKRKFVHVAEMEPELVVPDLTDFKLKPYVSYRTEEVYTNPFTAKELFNNVYASSVKKAFEDNKVENFEVPAEKIDEARLKAMQTGADLFESITYDGVGAPIQYAVDLPET